MASNLHGPLAAHSQLQQQFFRMSPALTAVGTPCGGGIQMASLFRQMEPPPPMVLSDPVSDLTCHFSGSRKRSRDDEGLPVPDTTPASNIMYAHQLQQQQQFLLQKQLMLHDALSVESSRANQSAMTSTSGRPLILASHPSVSSHGNHTTSSTSPIPTPSSSGLVSLVQNHSVEVDALVRLHADRLRSGLEDAQKRQRRAMAAALEQYAQRRVAQKQAELEAATKRNAELEDRLRQSAAETQAWFSAAKNNEALINGLQATLEQALLQKLNGNGGCHPVVDLSCAPVGEEGYGDSEEEGVTGTMATSSAALFLPVPCAETSSSLAGASRKKPATGAGSSFLCRRCGESDASVLVLPCRHLCLCPSCDAYVQDCPVCRHTKNATLQINLS